MLSQNLFISTAEDLLQVLELCSKSISMKDIETIQKHTAF